MGFVNQFKKDLEDNKDECIIKYELYGPNMESSYSTHMYNIPFEYFLFYVQDKGYNYTLHQTTDQVCDCDGRMVFTKFSIYYY